MIDLSDLCQPELLTTRAVSESLGTSPHPLHHSFGCFAQLKALISQHVLCSTQQGDLSVTNWMFEGCLFGIE